MKAFRWILFSVQVETQITSFPEEIYALTRQILFRLVHEYHHFFHLSINKDFFALAAGFPKLNSSLSHVTQSFLIRNIRQLNSFSSIYTKAIPMVDSNSLVALFKSSFGFCVVGRPSRPSPLLYSLQKYNPARRLTDHGWSSFWPIMADCRLPPANRFPFVTTGLDFVGSFPIKDNGQFGRRYCLLFPCFVTRAVHIETCAGLNTETTLMANTAVHFFAWKPTTNLRQRDNFHQS